MKLASRFQALSFFKYAFFFFILFSSVPALKAEDSGKKSESDKVAQTKTLPYFDRIVLSGIGNLYITQGQEQTLVVKAEAYLLPNVQAIVKDETLYLDFKKASEYPRAELNYYLSIKDLKAIQSLSSASVYIQEGLRTSELALEIHSFGNMTVKLSVDKLVAKIEGAGEIKAMGRADEQEIYIAGAGEFIGPTLKGRSVIVNITGSGDAKINAQTTLSATILGDGSVGYCGSPTVSKKISEKGMVKPLSEKECS